MESMTFPCVTQLSDKAVTIFPDHIYLVRLSVNKAPSLTVRRVIWILASVTVFVSSTNTSTNNETIMLSDD